MVPIGEKLMAKDIDRMTLLVEIIAEAHVDNSLLRAACLAAIDGVVGSDIELWRFLAWYHKTSSSFRVHCEVASDRKIESLKVEVDVDIIEEDVSCSQSNIAIDEVIVGKSRAS